MSAKGKTPVREPDPGSMRIEADRGILVDLATKAAAGASNRSALPVLAGTLIEGGVHLDGGLTVTRMAATDLEVFIRIESEIPAVEGGGRWAVPAKLFVELLKGLSDGKVTLTCADNMLQAVGTPKGKRAKAADAFTMTMLPAGDFPQEPTIEGAICEIDGKELGAMLKRVMPAVSSDEGRPVLTGVCWTVAQGRLEMAATDSYRLTVATGLEMTCEGEIGAIVPGSVLRRLPAHDGPVVVTLGENQVRFEAGRTTITSRLIEGKYPPYRTLMPAAYPSRLTADRAELMGAAEHAGVIAKANTPVRLCLGQSPDPQIEADDRGLILTARQTGVATAQQVVDSADWEGDPMEIGLAPRFLVDALRAFDCETITIDMIDPGRPVLIHDPQDPSYQHILMPVRLWT